MPAPVVSAPGVVLRLAVGDGGGGKAGRVLDGDPGVLVVDEPGGGGRNGEEPEEEEGGLAGDRGGFG